MQNITGRGNKLRQTVYTIRVRKISLCLFS